MVAFGFAFTPCGKYPVQIYSPVSFTRARLDPARDRVRYASAPSVRGNATHHLVNYCKENIALPDRTPEAQGAQGFSNKHRPVVATVVFRFSHRRTIVASQMRWFLVAVVIGCVAGQQNCPFYTTNVGDFKLTVLSDGTTPSGDLRNLVVDLAPSALEKAIQSYFLSIDGGIVVNYNPVHLDMGDRKVMFDTGSAQHFGPTAGKLLKNMRKAGLDPSEVDAVVLSHGHIDHLGGVLKPDGSMAFPNAQYFIGRVEHEYWSAATLEDELVQTWKIPPQIRESSLNVTKTTFDAMKDKLTLFEFGEEFLPGITSRATVGHSPGHSGFIIKSGEESFFISGDSIVVDFISVDHPEWKVVFDMNSTSAIETRFDLLEELASTGMRGSYYHVDFPGIGNIYRQSNGYGYRVSRFEL